MVFINKKGKVMQKVNTILADLGMFLLVAFLAMYTSGCMQLTGAKSIDLWGAKFVANSGFDVSAGVMQYDHALDRKGYSVGEKIGQ